MFFQDGNNSHTFTETVTACAKFCQGVCIPRKCVTKFPKSSPWCNKTIKAKIKAKGKDFRTKSNDRKLFHRTKVDLRKAVMDAK